MTTNIYASMLTPHELIIKILREKNQIPIGLHEFDWVGYATVEEGGRTVHLYTLEHKRKDLFNGQVVIRIKGLDKTTDPSTGNYVNYDFDIEPELNISNDVLNSNDCLFGNTEAMDVYNNNPVLRLNYLAKARVNKRPDSYHNPIIYDVPIANTN